MWKGVCTILFIFKSAFLYAQEPELVLPTGHTGKILLAKFSPGHKHILTAGEDRQIHIWETFSGLKLKSLPQQVSSITKAGFSSDGKFIYVSTDSLLTVWSFPSFSQVLLAGNVRDFIYSQGMATFYTLTYSGLLERYSANGKKDLSVRTEAHKLAGISGDGVLISAITKKGLELRDRKGGVVKNLAGTGFQSAYFIPGTKNITLVTSNEILRFHYESGFLDTISGISETKTYYSENGRFLAVIDRWDDVEMWDLEKIYPYFRFDTVYSQYDTIAYQDSSGNILYRAGNLATESMGRREYYSGLAISPDGSVLSSYGNVWLLNDIYNSYKVPGDYSATAAISAGNDLLLLVDEHTTTSVWELRGKKRIQQLKGRAARIANTDINRSGDLILVVEDNDCKIVSLTSGKTLHLLKKHKARIGSAFFSPDGKQVITNSYDNTACLWETASGKMVSEFKDHHYEYNPVYFLHNGELVKPSVFIDSVLAQDPVTMEDTIVAMVTARRNPANANLAFSLSGKYSMVELPYAQVFLSGSPLELHYDMVISALSPDDQLFAVAKIWTDSIFIADPSSGKWLKKFSLGYSPDEYGRIHIVQLAFTPGNRLLLVIDNHRMVHVVDIANGYQVIKSLPGEYCRISVGGERMVVLNNGKCDLYETKELHQLYSYISLGSEDYLVVEKKKRYDGTREARKHLYFSCGDEIIELDQFKDKLWVPDLAGRIISNDSIYSPGIETLRICGVTPAIEPGSTSQSMRSYRITPRLGGLGETVVYVNGIEVTRYRPEQLKKQANEYILTLYSKDLESYYTSHSDNTVNVRAFVKDNNISSRGLSVRDSSKTRTSVPPNLFAVMVGISEYKSDVLQLKYAAKDATDLSNAVAAAAKKLLNTDGKEHVFIYKLTTDPDRFRLPEKLAIRKTLEEIGKKATPNDILLIFFAGHGIMQGEKKQFYFLTSEATSATNDADLWDVGISTTELTDWIKPSSVKAQKRILIFDACNSGQAINDLVKIGKDNQGYVAARNDDRGQQMKLIEKLNERSGFTILSAAASNQSAYEMGSYAQGLLTYALLKSVKEEPGILVDGKYLDVGRWFNASKNTVESLTALEKLRQEPQFISNTNFVIGMVDEEVLSDIKLPVEKIIFSSTLLTNTTQGFDNLGLSRLFNARFTSISAKTDGTFIYKPDAPGSFSVNGSYLVDNETVTLNLNLVKDNAVRDRYSIKGSTSNLNSLLDLAFGWIETKIR